MLSKILVSEGEEQDQHDLDIEIVPQDDLDQDPTPIPNQKFKWTEKLIEAVGNVAGDPYDRRRMRFQYQIENVALSTLKEYFILELVASNFLLGLVNRS